MRGSIVGGLLVAFVVHEAYFVYYQGAVDPPWIPDQDTSAWDAVEVFSDTKRISPSGQETECSGRKIYIGSYSASMDIKGMQEHGIERVVSVGSNFRPQFDGVKYLILPVEDEPTANVLRFFDRAADFISSCGEGNVLVHCMQGKSRSAAVLAAAVIRNMQLTTDQAIAEMQRVRRTAPDGGFVRQLRIFEAATRLRRLKAGSATISIGLFRDDLAVRARWSFFDTFAFWCAFGLKEHANDLLIDIWVTQVRKYYSYAIQHMAPVK